jgi:hypothetical protein
MELFPNPFPTQQTARAAAFPGLQGIDAYVHVLLTTFDPHDATNWTPGYATVRALALQKPNGCCAADSPPCEMSVAPTMAWPARSTKDCRSQLTQIQSGSPSRGAFSSAGACSGRSCRDFSIRQSASSRPYEAIGLPQCASTDAPTWTVSRTPQILNLFQSRGTGRLGQRVM